MAITVADAERIQSRLNEIYSESESVFLNKKGTYSWKLKKATKGHLSKLSEKAPIAKSAFTNLVTCLICKATDNSVDCRYHRPPEGLMPAPPSGAENYFSGRGISESIVYPWLREKDFVYAHSGWQTRTFERPRPYALDYPENIGYVKEEFLNILNSVENDNELAEEALRFLFFLEIVRREQQGIAISTPSHDDISMIISFLERHFSYAYRQRGAARLPVLAIYAVYQAIVKEFIRYQGKTLLPLQEHAAADSSTGAIGDIEVIDESQEKFEGVEVKHGISINLDLIKTAYFKFREHQIERYYLLTTSEPHLVDAEACQQEIKRIKKTHGCQVIVNGVLPTIKYYLRLLKRPSDFFKYYGERLKHDTSIGYEHRARWNEIIAV